MCRLRIQQTGLVLDFQPSGLTRKKDVMGHECYFYHIRTIEKLIEKFKPKPRVAEEFIFSVHELLSANREMANPQLATEIHRLARFHLQLADLYAEEKRAANDMLLKNYRHREETVNGSNDPFSTAAKLAVIGNIID